MASILHQFFLPLQVKLLLHDALGQPKLPVLFRAPLFLLCLCDFLILQSLLPDDKSPMACLYFLVGAEAGFDYLLNSSQYLSLARMKTFVLGRLIR